MVRSVWGGKCGCALARKPAKNNPSANDANILIVAYLALLRRCSSTCFGGALFRHQSLSHKINVPTQAIELVGERGGHFHRIDGLLNSIQPRKEVLALRGCQIAA